MSDSDVQAGRTAAARHASESGIKAEDMNKPESFQQRHSRKGKGLDVTVQDASGEEKTTTRHPAQEGLIDAAVDRVKGANNGKLTPQGQLDAAAEVRCRTENIPMDQRDVERLRKSGPSNATPRVVTPGAGESKPTITKPTNTKPFQNPPLLRQRLELVAGDPNGARDGLWHLPDRGDHDRIARPQRR